jgi:hypothetical protein
MDGNRKEGGRPELDDLIDSGIRRIRATWNRLGSFQLRAGPYGKQYLLQQIYTVYCEWRDSGEAKTITARLRCRLPDESLSPDGHLLELLIRVALPKVKPNVIAIWVNAIRYGEDHHVRPFKLRGFFHVNGGLVRCARLFGEEEENRRKREEARRLDEQERELEIRQARLQARRQRARPSMPVGMASFFDRYPNSRTGQSRVGIGSTPMQCYGALWERGWREGVHYLIGVQPATFRFIHCRKSGEPVNDG